MCLLNGTALAKLLKSGELHKFCMGRGFVTLGEGYEETPEEW